jgi:voltage-gated potassium channel
MKNPLDKFHLKIKKFLSNQHNLQFIHLFLIVVSVVLAGGIIIPFFERTNQISTIFDGIWWALVTITTVGYGDLVPQSVGGRVIGIVFILLGFVSFSIFTAFIASTFIDIKIKERKGLGKIKDKNHILICGWNKSIHKILNFIAKKEVKNPPTIVLVNEIDEDSISYIQNSYSTLAIKFIKGDFTNQEVLKRANIQLADSIILLYDTSKANVAPSDERTIIAAHNVIFMKVKGNITLQLRDEKYLPNVRRDKIHNVIIFDEIGGNLLATSTLHPSVPDFIQEAFKYKDGTGFREVSIPTEFVTKTYGELADYFKQKQNYVLLGIVSEQVEFSIDKVLSDDSSSIDQFIKKQFELSRKKFKTEETKAHVKIKPDDSYVIQETDKAIVL